MRRKRRTIGRPSIFKEPTKATTTLEKEESVLVDKIRKYKKKSKSKYLRDLVRADIVREVGVAALSDDKESE